MLHFREYQALQFAQFRLPIFGIPGQRLFGGAAPRPEETEATNQITWGNSVMGHYFYGVGYQVNVP